MIGFNFETWSLSFGNSITAKTKQTRDNNKADTPQQHSRGKNNIWLAFSYLLNEKEASPRVEYKSSNCLNLKFPGWQNAPNFCHDMKDKLPLSVSRRFPEASRKHLGPTRKSWWIVGSMGSRSGRWCGCHGHRGAILWCGDWRRPNLSKIIDWNWTWEIRV
jgi:hypothetical protein